ncbi:MAG: hypothetical protein EPN84_12200 [Legionella sp.]|nr:MAG: hypothetical protein EPN84_12200 [Legionella sp.]
MDFLFINTRELSALMGLPHIQQLAYVLGIRPYMDRQSFIVGGVKRRISYKSLAETLYVEPHQGIIKSGSPSRPQLRRVIKGLEKAGLIEIKSDDMHLILKCLLAESDDSVKNKPVTNPSSQPVMAKVEKNADLSTDYAKQELKADIVKNTNPVTPHNSKKDLVCLSNFEKFWEIYPKPVDKPKAWDEFEKLNPDGVLFSKIMNVLKSQITSYDDLQKEGLWVPNWKYPANWLAQESWESIPVTQINKETSNEKNRGNNSKKSTFNSFWEACGRGANLSFDDIAATP